MVCVIWYPTTQVVGNLLPKWWHTLYTYLVGGDMWCGKTVFCKSEKKVRYGIDKMESDDYVCGVLIFGFLLEQRYGGCVSIPHYTQEVKDCM